LRKQAIFTHITCTIPNLISSRLRHELLRVALSSERELGLCLEEIQELPHAEIFF
jgi:hypothetical protein